MVFLGKACGVEFMKQGGYCKFFKGGGGGPPCLHTYGLQQFAIFIQEIEYLPSSNLHVTNINKSENQFHIKTKLPILLIPHNKSQVLSRSHD